MPTVLEREERRISSIAVAAMALLLALLVLGVGFSLVRDLTAQRDLGDARVALGDILKLQLDEETGMRGYSATGVRLFVEPYDRALGAFGPAVRRARTAASAVADPAGSADLDTLVALNATWRDIAAPIFAGARADVALQRRGKEIVDRFRSVVAAADARLALTARRVDRDATRSLALVASLTLALALFSGWLIAQLLRRSFRATAGGLRTSAIRSVGDALPQLMWTATRDGTITWANRAWYAYTRLQGAADAFGAAALRRIMPADDVDRTMRETRAAIAAGRPIAFETPMRPADGGPDAYRSFLVRITPVHEDGQIAGWIGTATDIHDTRIAHVQREENLRAIAELSNDIVWRRDVDGGITYFNAAWFAYTGLDEARSYGNAWLDAVHPADRESWHAMWRSAIARREPYQVDYRLRAADGSYAWFWTTGRPLLAPDGSISDWYGTLVNIDMRRRVEEELRERLRRGTSALLAFQEAALPRQLPEIPGIAFSAVYAAAEADALVGGDWYDAFRLDDGRVVVSVGDVVGSGLEAAVTMAAIRQAIRGAANIFPDPVAVLDAAERTLRADRPDDVATAFVGIIDLVARSFTYATAGHPLPIVRGGDGTIRQLAGGGLPLGLRGSIPPEQNASDVVPLDEPSMLVLYTDGLVEGERDLIEGEAKLLKLIASPMLDGPDPATALRAALVAEPRDDVAVLVVRIDDASRRLVRVAADEAEGEQHEFRVSDPAAARAVRERMAQTLRASGFPEDAVMTAELVYSELVGNVMRHADDRVAVVIDLAARVPVLHVLDRGPGFFYSPALPKDIYAENGRGLYIASMLTRNLTITPRPDGGSHARVVFAFGSGDLRSGALGGVRPATSRG